MKKYAEGKERARAEAITWQQEAAERSMSYAELAEAQAHFEMLARRFGLVREFKENGII